MDRRSFLKTIGVGFGGLYFNPFSFFAPNAWYGFDPNSQYGDYVTTTAFIDRELMFEASHIIIPKIRDVIPPKFRRNIEYIIANPYPGASDPLSQVGHIGWLYRPKGRGGFKVLTKGWKIKHLKAST